METFTNLEKKLNKLSKELSELNKMKQIAEKSYIEAQKILSKVEGEYNLKKSEVDTLKSGLESLYKKKLDILLR